MKTLPSIHHDMYLFFNKDVTGSTVLLTADESFHCIKVLRHHQGDHIKITDGRGTFCDAIIVSDDPGSCSAEIMERKSIQPPTACNIHIAIAPTKNMNRFEYFLEKSTELGISTITPLICQRSERKVLKIERLQKVLLSAMKQSFSGFLPELRGAITLPFFIATNEGTHAMKFIGHCAGSDRQQLKDIYKRGLDVVVLIGPEGDFTSEEITLSLQHGYAPVVLGRNRLRTETAGLVACHSIHLLNEIS